MSDICVPPLPVRNKQRFLSRVFWFGVGAIISYGLNAGPFYYFHHYLGWPKEIAYFCSLSLVTLFFFFWNYFLNFRTASAWHGCASRYLTTILILYLANYSLTQIGLHWNPKWWAGIIGAVQVLLGPIKFLLYHYWVFPRASGDQSTHSI